LRRVKGAINDAPSDGRVKTAFAEQLLAGVGWRTRYNQDANQCKKSDERPAHDTMIKQRTI
jgi:hypothetical protein